MNRDADLRQLLLLLFDIGELRVHLGDEPHGEILSHSLPDGSITPEHFVSAVVQLLKRHGLIDREFFDRLELARVNRVSDIRKVRSKWLENAKLESGEKWADRRYELVSLCGKGGFGIVWEANDTHTGAIVAVKILLEQHADDRRIRQRFFRGAEALKRLSHPAICGVRSSVQQEGQRYFYVMDYIDGSSLASLVGVRPQAELLEYVLQIGEALEHVHQHGLLHRDVKPTNILVAGKQAKLIDFDLVTGDGYTQMTSRALGTVFYAPPEANSGEKKIRAYDVYSLARTVEFVIRGRELNVADQDSLDTLDAKKNVKSVLRTALHVDPKRRTQTAAQFCADLRRALELTDRNTRNRAVSSTARQTPDITPNQQPALASSEIAAEHWTRSYLAWVGGVVGRLGIRVQRAGLVLLAIMAFTVLIFAYTLLSSPLTTPSEKQASTMDDPGAASQLATTTTAPAMAPSVDEITSPGGVTGNALAHVRARRDFLSRYRGTVPDPSVDREGYDYAQSELAEADADLAILAAIAAEARSDAAESTARLKDALNELDRARVGVVEGDERFGILKERRDVVQSWADASAAMYAAEKAAAANDRTTQSEHLQQAVAAYSQATAADKAGRYMMLERQRDAAAKMADALKAVETEKQAVETEKTKGAVVAPPSGQPPRPKLQDKMWFKWPKIGFGVSAGILAGGSIAAGVLYGVYRSNYAKAATADDATYADIVARNAHVTRGIFTTAVVLVPMAFVGTTVFATLWGKRVRKAKMWGKKLHVTPSAMQIPGGPVYGFFMRF